MKIIVKKISQVSRSFSSEGYNLILPFCSKNCIMSLQKCDADISVCKGSIPLRIKRTQFSLVPSWTCTKHKLQSLILEEDVPNYDLEKKIKFEQALVYATLSRV